MRILVVSEGSGFMLGGVATETVTLLNGLCRRGHTVAIASDAPLRGVNAATHFPIHLPIDEASSTQLRLILSNFKPDFVHVIFVGSRGLFRFVPLLRNLRWALTIHSVPPYERKLLGWHMRERAHYFARWVRYFPNALLWRGILRANIAPTIIVHSEFVREVVVRYGTSPSRLRMIHLPFISSPNARRPVPRLDVKDGPLMVTVGGLAHTKGQHDVIKAMPALLRCYPNLKYQVIGEIRDNSYLSYIRSLVVELGIQERVLITPHLDFTTKEAVLNRADVYVQPSHEEGFCIAFAEGAAIVPRLVGTDTGAIRAMSRLDDGARIVPTKSPHRIAAAVLDLLELRLPDDCMSARANRLSREFSESRYLDEHEKLYSNTTEAS